MKKIIFILIIISSISGIAYCQNSSFTAEDFKNHVDKKITVTLKNTDSPITPLFIKEVKEKYIVCTYWKNNENILNYILIDQIAAFRVWQEEEDENSKKK